MIRSLILLVWLLAATFCVTAQVPATERIKAVNKNIAAAMQKNDLKAAAKYAREAVELSESHFGPSSRQTAISYENLGTILANDNKHKLAIEPFQKALEIFRKDAASSTDAVKILGKLAGSQLESGQSKEAETSLLEYRTSAETKFGAQSKELVQAKVAMACFYERAREPVKAFNEFTESYALALNAFGRDSAELDHVGTACQGTLIDNFWDNTGRMETARKRLSGLLGYEMGKPTKLHAVDHMIDPPLRGPIEVTSDSVVVKVWLDEHGNVKDAKLVFGGSRFKDLALSGAKDSRFRPSQKDGKPIADVLYFGYTFIRQ